MSYLEVHMSKDLALVKASDKGNVANGSLRSLVSKNEEAMHQVASRLGEVTTVRKNIDALKEDLEGQIGCLFERVETLTSGNVEVSKSMNQIKDLFKQGLFKVEKEVGNVKYVVECESVGRKGLEKKFEDLSTKLIERSKWHKRYWVAVGVFLLVLVGCLGYLDYKLGAMSVVGQKQKIQEETQTPSTLKSFNVKKDSALLPSLSKPVVKGRQKHRNKHLDRLRFYKG